MPLRCFKALKNFANFHGRANRAEFWMFAIITCVLFFLVFVIEVAIAGGPRAENQQAFPPLATAFYLLMILPGLTVQIRRIHDLGLSGWWILAGCIPYLGPFILLLFFVSKGNSRENQYGEPPY